MGSVIDMPDCPECSTDMEMQFGNVDFGDSGVIHHFDCPDCGEHAEWTSTELNEMGIERPSLKEFIEYFNLTKDDVSEVFSTSEIVGFLQEKSDLSSFSESDSLREFVENAGVSLNDITSYFGREKVEELTEKVDK